MDKKDVYEVNIEENYSGDSIVSVVHNEKKYYLNSKYNVNELTDIWCNQFDISNPFSICIVFGISDGLYIKRLNDINKDMLIIAYEPNEDIAEICKEKGYLNAMGENVIVLYGKESLPLFYVCISNSIAYENVKYVKYYISPNYEHLYPEETENTRKKINNEIDKAKMSVNTVNLHGDVCNKNITFNAMDRVEQYSLCDLVNEIRKYNLSDIPAIVVAAGPSLDKNIKFLNRAEGKAFIIAVDTSLNAFAKYNILPDLCVTIDPIKPVSFLSDDRMKRVPLVYHQTSNKEIAEIHLGKRFYQDSTASIYDLFIDKFNKGKMYLESGGTVANDACSLACMCGFKTIIFIGQDLAYPDNKEHTEAAYGVGKNNIIDENSSKYFYVEDNYGGKIKTEYNMNSYRLWYENHVKTYPHIKFVNATEGGAKINGMEFISLNEAIDKYCISENKVNFKKIIDEVEPEFTYNEKKEIYEYFSNFETHINEIRKKVRDGIKLYDILYEYNENRNYACKGFKTTYKKITELNNWITNGKDVKYLSNYAAEKIFESLEDVYEEKDSEYEEIKFLINKGKESLKNLLSVTYKVVEDFRDNILKAKEKCEVI